MIIKILTNFEKPSGIAKRWPERFLAGACAPRHIPPFDDMDLVASQSYDRNRSIYYFISSANQLVFKSFLIPKKLINRLNYIKKFILYNKVDINDMYL
jgi:hypothetical protein